MSCSHALRTGSCLNPNAMVYVAGGEMFLLVCFCLFKLNFHIEHITRGKKTGETMGELG